MSVLSKVKMDLFKSNKPNKKYTAVFSEFGKVIKVVHFGSAEHKDYIIYYNTDGETLANKRKDAYIRRHEKRESDLWKNNSTAPATLSRWILWNKPSLFRSLRDYKKRFGFK